MDERFAYPAYTWSLTADLPIRGRPWEYVFYADFLRGDDRLAKGALLQLQAVADMVKVLGVYRAA